MPTTLSAPRPDRLLLLSRDLRECLPPANRAHHVSDLVEPPVELGAFYAPCEGDCRRNAPCESLGTVDAGEDERYGEEVSCEALPVETQRREMRLATIEQAKARLEATQRTADDACGRRPEPPSRSGAGRASEPTVNASPGRRATSPTPRAES